MKLASNIALLVSVLATCAHIARAAPSDLDRTFAEDGTRLVSQQPFYTIFQQPNLPVRVRSDGRILALVQELGDLPSTLYQFNADGTPDTAFGNGTGKISVQQAVCSRWSKCWVYAFELQGDGKVVFALVAPGLKGWFYAAGRVLADGRPDPAFGVAGGTALSDQTWIDTPHDIAVLPDGRIVVGGSSATTTQNGMNSAARFLPDGTPDMTFGTNGRVLVAAAPAYFAAFRVQPDGKLIWAGRPETFGGTQIVRAHPDGQIDTSFGAGGTYRPSPPTQFTLSGVTAESNGSLLLAGSTPVGQTDALAAMRLTPQGIADASFGVSGVASVSPLPGKPSAARAIQVDSQGRLVLVGVAGDAIYSSFQPLPMLQAAVVRLTPQGAADLTFAPYGATHFWSGYGSDAVAVAIADGDAILVGGTSERAPHTGYFDFIERTPLPALFRLKGGSSEYAHKYDRQTTAVEFHHAGYDHYFLTANPDEVVTLDFNSTEWKRTGQSFKVWAEAGYGQPVCRFFSDQSFAPKSSHFYTNHSEECDALPTGPVWTYEGIAFYMGTPNGPLENKSCPTGAVPLYRLYNNGQGGAPNHRYTTDITIAESMTSAGWIFEPQAGTRVFACVPA